MRICIFCERWESGGIESFVTNLLINGGFDFTRYRVVIVAAEFHRGVFADSLKKRGVVFHELSGNRYNYFLNMRLFVDILKNEQFDVVYIQAYQSLAFLYAFVAKCRRIPIRAVHSHNTELRQGRGVALKLAIHNSVKYAFCSCATDFLSCSAAAAQFMFCGSVIREKKWTFVPNGINTAQFQFSENRRRSIRNELGINEAFIVGNVGRFCTQKNQSFLLDIFKEINKTDPESVLLLVGDGDDREKLQRKAQELQIEKNIIFYGVSKQIADLLSAMDVFVFPSLFEGLGIVAVEAQAAGLPVVCSERIPDEALLLNTVSVVPLSQSASFWATTILQNKGAQIDRTLYAAKIKEKHFDIEYTSQVIQQVF